MRILHIVDTLSAAMNGPAKMTVEMAAATARRGHEVAIYATDHGGVPVSLDKAHAGGVDIRVFPAAFPRIWKRSPALADALERTLPTVDLVHLHSLYFYHHWVASALCQRLDIPYVIRPHGLLDPVNFSRLRPIKSILEHSYQDRSLRRANAIHYSSSEEMRRSSPNAVDAPGAVVPLGIHIADYTNLPTEGLFRAKHPEIGNRRIVLFLGRLAARKGLDLLVPAFDQAVRSGLDLHLVIAGPDGGGETTLHSRIAEAGLGDRTTHAGLLTHVDKIAAYTDAEVLFLPAHAENFGLPVVEAMACGLPVLISDRVNIWPEIEFDGAGVVCCCNGPSMGKALADMMRNPNRLSQMGAAGRIAAGRRYDWDKVAEQLETMYRVAIERQPVERPEHATNETSDTEASYFEIPARDIAAGAAD